MKRLAASMAFLLASSASADVGEFFGSLFSPEQAGVQETRVVLEKTGFALEEFKATYGKYPPVPVYGGKQPVRYEHPTVKGWSLDGDAAERAEAVLAAEADGKKIEWSEKEADGKGVLFTFGLCSFFLPRYNGTADQGPTKLCGTGFDGNGGPGTGQHSKYACTQWSAFNRILSGSVGDSEKDLAASGRMLAMLDGRLRPDGSVDAGIVKKNKALRTISLPGRKPFLVVNAVWTIVDAWGRELRYSSYPPFESYDLRSAGPDGKFDTNDDVVLGDERECRIVEESAAAKVEATRSTLSSLETAALMYHIRAGRWPASVEDMQKSLDGSPPLLDPQQSAKDGWGKPFRFRFRDGMLEISSAGPDGVFGTADDLSNNPR